MPEGPEVTRMTSTIRRVFEGAILEKIVSSMYSFSSLRLPQKIVKVGNRGKFVYIVLSKKVIGIVPGMTGHLLIPGKTRSFETQEGYVYATKHNHVTFVTNRGEFVLNDPRKFSRLFVYTPETLEEKLNKLGPDLLKDLPKMSLRAFQEHLSRYRSEKILADLLLDQSFVAGVGNYLRAEAMYVAKLYPLRRIGTLSSHEVGRLKRALEKVGKESFKAQTKKLHTYAFRIYQQPQAKSIRRQNRTLWYDPKVQKIDLEVR